MAEQLMLVEDFFDDLLRAADSHRVISGYILPKVITRDVVFLSRFWADGVAITIVVRVILIECLL
ncbi:hypothetical protein D3C76_1539970 [compost metagenome]